MTFTIGQVFTERYPPEAAVWCNANNAHIVEKDGSFVIVENPPPEPESIEVDEV